MIEAVMLWNEPNNLSHWDFELDPGWERFSRMVSLAGDAIAAEAPGLTRVMGGISSIDPAFIQHLDAQGALSHVDVVAVHGFPLDWNHWQLNEWPARIAELEAVARHPVWVTEVGVSSFGAEEVQEFGFTRTVQLLLDRVERVYWYSLFDLPRTWPATTRHRESEGSSYYRHFYMGLVREDGTPKPALRLLAEHAPALGLCQWFHYEDHRLDDAVRLLREHGVRRLRTGLSWGDSHRPGFQSWFDRQMKAIEAFDVTLTFCFTPPSRGLRPDHTSPPQQEEEFAEFCAQMVKRYAR